MTTLLFVLFTHFSDKMPAMKILDLSIKAAGSVSALAKHLNVEPNVISNWKARGVPDGWATALKVMRKHKDGAFKVTNVSHKHTSMVANCQKKR